MSAFEYDARRIIVPRNQGPRIRRQGVHDTSPISQCIQLCAIMMYFSRTLETVLQRDLRLRAKNVTSIVLETVANVNSQNVQFPHTYIYIHICKVSYLVLFRPKDLDCWLSGLISSSVPRERVVTPIALYPLSTLYYFRDDNHYNVIVDISIIILKMLCRGISRSAKKSDLRKKLR